MTPTKDPRSRRAGLTRARTAEGALRLIDRDGVGKLTMRALAGELDVHVMSLYNHVDDKEDLLDAVASHLVGSIPTVEPDLAWDDTLRALADGVRHVVLEHPQAASLLATRPINSPEALRAVDSALAALRRAGLEPEEAVSTFWVIGSFLLGALIGEAASRIERRPVSIGPDQVEAAADAAPLPALAELSPWILASSWETEFHRSIELLINDVRARTAG